MIGFMPSRTRKATAITSAVVALLAGGASVVATPASAAGPRLHGCPYGAVCIYPEGRGLNDDRPEPGGIYFSYGAHNLRNQLHSHTIVNNQYGGARYALCTRYGGFGWCTKLVAPGRADPYDLTPYNSIVLAPFCPPTHCPDK
jgi:hypothetical protein